MGGGTVEPSRSSLRSLLYLTPTHPFGEDYPPFPISEQPLSEWMGFSDAEEPMSPITQPRIALNEILKDMDDISETPVPLSDFALKEAIVSGAASDQATNEAIKEAVHSTPSMSFGMDCNHLVGVVPSKTYSPELSTTDFAFISGSTSTKVQIAIALAKAEMQGWQLLSGTCARQLREWSDKIVELESLQNIIKGSRIDGEKMIQILRESANTLDAAQAEIDNAKKVPLIDHAN